MNIKAIETHYAGHHFRSRLEARWAVFFDTLGIRWQYEPEGFEDTISGFRYLPDFYLPDVNGGVYFEVKGEWPVDRDYQYFASYVTPRPLVFACGQLPGPTADSQDVLLWWSFRVSLDPLIDHPKAMGHVTEVFLQFAQEKGATAGDEIFLTPVACGRPNFFLTAFTKARQARFEHGETPSAPVRGG